MKDVLCRLFANNMLDDIVQCVYISSYLSGNKAVFYINANLFFKASGRISKYSHSIASFPRIFNVLVRFLHIKYPVLFTPWVQ